MAGVDFRGLWPGKLWPRRSSWRGRGDATDCAGVGFGAILAGGFLEAAGSYKTVTGACFRGRGACTQYDPKIILCAKTLQPKGDAYYGSQRS